MSYKFKSRIANRTTRRPYITEEVLYKSSLREEKLTNSPHSKPNATKDMSEEVLFKSNLQEEKIGSKTLQNNAPKDINEEVLYKKNLYEEKVNSKPHSPYVYNSDLKEEVLYKGNMREEKIDNAMHSPYVPNTDLKEEVLYKGNMREEKIGNAIHSPYVPNTDLKEEVLFRGNMREEKLYTEMHAPYVEEPEEQVETIMPLDVDEEVLYRGDLKEEKLANKTHSPLTNNTDIGEEILYKTYLREEKLSGKAHANETNTFDIHEEVLYTTGYEDIDYVENASLKEESLAFKHPVVPSYVLEEVLYDENGNRLSQKEFNEPVIANEETLNDDNISIDDSAITFDDIDINVSLDENAEDFETEKIVYKKKSFAEKMFDCDPIILERYDELKNLLLLHKKVKSRISNTCDTFKLGSTRLAKISTSGKSLKLYLNLDMNEVEPRLKCKEAGHKKAYEETPVFLRIRSPRSMRNAKYLINQLATKFNLVENPKFTTVNSVELLKEKLN